MFFKYIRKDKLKNKTMNSFIKKAFSLLLIGCFLVLGLGVVRVNAEETAYKTAIFGSSYNSRGVSSYTDSWSSTNQGFTVNLTNFNNNNNGWSYVKCGSKKGDSTAIIETDSEIDKAITKVVVRVDACTVDNVNSFKLYVSSNSEYSEDLQTITETISAGDITFNIPNPDENLFYKIEVDCKQSSNNGIVQISKVDYYIEDTSGPDPDPDTVAVTGVSLNKSSFDLQVGDSETLIATVLPDNASNKNVTWESSNTSVATVDNGVITAKSVGNTTITVTTEDGSHTATCDVTVIPSSKGTIVFGTNNVKINSASVEGDDSLGNTWTITTVGTTSFTTNASYYQVGSSSKPATSITFTTTLSENLLLDSLEIKLGGFNGTAGDVSIKIDNQSVGTGLLNATSDVIIKNSKVLTGKTITVEITNISKGVKVYYISYHYAKSYSYIQGSVGLDANSKGAFRLLGVSGSDAYDSYGVAYKNSTGTWHERTNLSVYDSVYAYDGAEKVSYTAAELGGSVIFGVEVTGLPKGVYTVTIKSFVEIASVKYYSAERTFTITVNDSGVNIVEA